MFYSLIILLYLAGSFFFFLNLEVFFERSIFLSIQFLCIPLAIAACIYGYTWRKESSKYEDLYMSKWSMATLLFIIVCISTYPYVMAVNAYTDSGKVIVYQGEITHKRSKKRFKGGRIHSVTFKDEATGKFITLNCGELEYVNYKVGNLVSEKFYLGGLGIPFRWK